MKVKWWNNKLIESVLSSVLSACLVSNGLFVAYKHYNILQ